MGTDYIKQPSCLKAWRDPQKLCWQHLSIQAAQHFHTRDAIGNLISQGRNNDQLVTEAPNINISTNMHLQHLFPNSLLNL